MYCASTECWPGASCNTWSAIRTSLIRRASEVLLNLIKCSNVTMQDVLTSLLCVCGTWAQCWYIGISIECNDRRLHQQEIYNRHDEENSSLYHSGLPSLYQNCDQWTKSDLDVRLATPVMLTRISYDHVFIVSYPPRAQGTFVPPQSACSITDFISSFFDRHVDHKPTLLPYWLGIFPPIPSQP